MTGSEPTRIFRPGLRAYLPLGAIVAGLVSMFVVVWITRGPGTGIWQPAVLIVALYVLWCVVVRARVVVVSETGLTCSYLLRPPRTVAWRDVHHTAVTYWPGHVPIQVLVYRLEGDPRPLNIALGLYRRDDVDYLLTLEQLKVSR